MDIKTHTTTTFSRRQSLATIASLATAAALATAGASAWAQSASNSSTQNTTTNKGKPMVKFTTSLGTFTLQLDAEKAPKTVANFLSYVNAGHYTNTVFHRVIGNFMVQGGGFEPGMKQKPAPRTVENEANNGLKNDNYTVAMARTNDPHSASAQFFVNIKNNDFLNHSSPTPQGWGYTVFGKVVEGTDTIDKIKVVKTTSKMGHSDVPIADVIIEKAEVV